MKPFAKNLAEYKECATCGARLFSEYKGWNRSGYVEGIYPEEKIFVCGFQVVWNRLLGVKILTECPNK